MTGVRTAVRVTSIATFPPPMTTTFSPVSRGLPRLTSRRNSMPMWTPSASAPGTVSLRPAIMPAAMTNAL